MVAEVLVLNKPAGHEAGLGAPAAATAQRAHASRSQGAPLAQALLTEAHHVADDASGIRVLQRHFKLLACHTPLPTEASGLVVYTQDARIAGTMAEGGLARLCHGLSFNGRPLPPVKVSWQNETRLRFALKGIRPGQVPSMCEAVGLRVVALRRIRLGRVPLAKMPEGQWRYLQPWEKF